MPSATDTCEDEDEPVASDGGTPWSASMTPAELWPSAAVEPTTPIGPPDSSGLVRGPAPQPTAPVAQSQPCQQGRGVPTRVTCPKRGQGCFSRGLCFSSLALASLLLRSCFVFFPHRHSLLSDAHPAGHVDAVVFRQPPAGPPLSRPILSTRDGKLMVVPSRARGGPVRHQ